MTHALSMEYAEQRNRLLLIPLHNASSEIKIPLHASIQSMFEVYLAI